jgi:hypothetical protein
MHRRLLLTTLCLLSCTAQADGLLDAMLSTDPVTEATIAFNAGDHRHLVVPVCRPMPDEAMPGWPRSGPTPPAFWAALDKARRPFRCDNLGEDMDSANQLRLLRYAEQYNKTLLDLEK